MELSGASALVVGGAGGFGEATVRRLVDAGVQVVIADLSEEKGKALEAELDSPSVRFVRTDVTSEESMQAAVSAAAGLGPLRVAVAVHGGIAAGRRMVNRAGETYGLETFRRTTEIFLNGTFNVLSTAAAAMSRNDPLESGQRGVVITTASIAGFEGQVGQTDYSAAKGGVIALTLTAARDLAPTGVRVMCIAPGTFFTPAFMMPEAQAFERFGGGIVNPKRMGRVDEYAGLALEICRNDYLNGSVVRIDGALRFGA